MVDPVTVPVLVTAFCVPVTVQLQGASVCTPLYLFGLSVNAKLLAPVLCLVTNKSV